MRSPARIGILRKAELSGHWPIVPLQRRSDSSELLEVFNPPASVNTNCLFKAWDWVGILDGDRVQRPIIDTDPWEAVMFGGDDDGEAPR